MYMDITWKRDKADSINSSWSNYSLKDSISCMRGASNSKISGGRDSKHISEEEI